MHDLKELIIDFILSILIPLLLMMIGDAPALGIGDLDEDGAISASDLQMVAGRVQSSEHCSAA
jgi:hypothetical protein